MLDADGLSQEPGSNNSTAETFRKVPAWTILFDNGIHQGSLAEFFGGECDDHRNGLPPETMSVLRLLDPNSHLGFVRIDIVKSCYPEEFQ